MESFYIENDENEDDISTGAIVAIVILSIFLAAAIGVIIFCHFRNSKQ